MGDHTDTDETDSGATDSTDPLLWDIPETARQLGGVSTRTVSRLINAGEISSIKVRGRVLVPVSEVKTWVAQQIPMALNKKRVDSAVRNPGGNSTCRNTSRTETVSSKEKDPRTRKGSPYYWASYVDASGRRVRRSTGIR